MKKNTAQVVVAVEQPKQARKLFGISSDQLSAVYGGGGAVVHANSKPGI